MYTVDARSNQETRVLYFTCNDSNTIKSLYAKLANDSVLPKVGIVTVSDKNYTGLYWDRQLNEEVWYTPYGRFFSTEEMDSGADVVLLGTNFFKNLPQENLDTIWETGIDINGTHFNAIGNFFFVYANASLGDSFYESLPMQTSIVIPLKTYFHIGLAPERFRCVFCQSLTSAQITHLSDLLQPFNNIQSLSLPKSYEVGAVNSYINGIILYIAVLILSLLSAVSIILYWLRKEFARYRIYLICGAKGRQIAFFISLNVALLVTITYVCAFLAVSGITKITPQGIVSPLPWQFYIPIYIGVMLFTLLAVNIRAIPLVFREKMLQK
jgi:hypothetical protein